MQNEKNLSSVSFCAMFCVFTVACGIISAPFYKNSLTPLIIAGGLGIISAFVFTKLSEWFLRLKNEFLNGILYAVIIAFSGVFAYLSAKEFTGFIYKSVLVQENMFFIKLIFALCVFFLAVSDIGAIYKFSFISAFFISIIFIVLFFASIKTFDLKNLKGVFGVSDISLKQTANYYSKLFLSVFGACVFAAHTKKSPKVGLLAAAGTAVGIFLCLIIMIDTVLSFGLPFAAKLPFAYIDDISTVTVGSLFTRMDGFAYFAFFVCYVLKCAVLIRLSANLILKSGIKNKKTVCAVLSALLLL